MRDASPGTESQGVTFSLEGEGEAGPAWIGLPNHPRIQDEKPADNLLSLSRLNYRLPGREAHPEVVQGTTEFHHEIADASLPQADAVFDDATALDTAVDVLDPEPAVVQGLVGPLLL